MYFSISNPENDNARMIFNNIFICIKMIHSLSLSENATEFYFHVITYFLIIFVYYYTVTEVKYNSIIEKDVYDILDDNCLYDNISLSSADKANINILVSSDVITTKRKAKNDKKILYLFLLFLFLFTIFSVIIMIIGKYNRMTIKRVLYSFIVGAIYLLTIRLAFIKNVELKYEKVDRNEMKNRIISEIEKLK